VSPPPAERDAEEASPSTEVFREPAGPSAPETRRPEDADRERLVLVADAEIEAGKAIAGALVEAGLQPVLVHDGVEAILTIQRTLPRAVILDAGLPKMFGFQICELMKRNESLRHIQVVLIGAIHHRDRYRRAPSEIYGADAYLERHHVRENLLSTLQGFGLPVGKARVERSAPPRPIPAPPPVPRELPRATRPAAVPATRPVAPQAGEARAQRTEAERSSPRPAVAPAAVPGADPALAAEIARAERLARIIVSDVVLYNEEKLNAAIRAGNVSQSFEAEMAEGRGHFAQRVDARVREMRDFLGEELLRVARSRGMR
jgi:CheY-like chemotaxis protein